MDDGHMVRIYDALFLDEKQEVARCIMGLQVHRRFDISFTKGRMLHQLPHLVHVPLGEFNRTERFYNQQAIVFVVELYLVDGSSGDNYIIAVFEGHFAIGR